MKFRCAEIFFVVSGLNCGLVLVMCMALNCWFDMVMMILSYLMYRGVRQKIMSDAILARLATNVQRDTQ